MKHLDSSKFKFKFTKKFTVISSDDFTLRLMIQYDTQYIVNKNISQVQKIVYLIHNVLIVLLKSLS